MSRHTRGCSCFTCNRDLLARVRQRIEANKRGNEAGFQSILYRMYRMDRDRPIRRDTGLKSGNE